MFIEALWQKWVESSQPVEVVGYINEPGLDTSVQESTIDCICSHNLTHISNVNRTRGSNTCGNGMRAALLKLLGDNVGPMNGNALIRHA